MLCVKFFHKNSCKIFPVEIKFSDNLKVLRTECGLSQGKLAAEVGVTQQCVSKWERAEGEPTLTYLWKLADLFGVSIDVLCGRKDW